MNKNPIMIDENTALFDGCIFKRAKTGAHKDYFRCRRVYDKHNGKTLHVAVFTVNSGIAPSKGYTVHHVDCNRLNNDFDNLKLMTTSEHIKLHNELEPDRIVNACLAAAKRNKELGYVNSKLAVEASRKKGWPGSKASADKYGKRIVVYNSYANTESKYNSIREASRLIGISTTSISNCLKGRYNSIRGYCFKEVGAK